MKQIVVLSGKGGTGKTSVTAALAGLGPRKVLADCDVDAADLHLILRPDILERHDFRNGWLAGVDPDLCAGCGRCAEACRFGAIDKKFQVRPHLCEGCGACAFVCPANAIHLEERLCGQWFVSDTRFGPFAHAALATGAENSGRLVTTVRKAASAMAEKLGIDWVLIDGSPGVGCPVIASLASADLALLVAEPSFSGLHDLKRASDLCRHFRIKTLTLINKADMNPRLVEEIRHHCEAQESSVCGVIGQDDAFVKAQLRGRSVVEESPRLHDAFKEVWKDVERTLTKHSQFEHSQSAETPVPTPEPEELEGNL